MSDKTNIQWCDTTCNPTMGCDGCELWGPQRKVCYAGVLHLHRGGRIPGYAPSFEEVTLFPGRVAKACRMSELRARRRANKPWLDGLPRLVFVSDMSDALSKAVTFEFLAAEVVENVASQLGKRHRWLWLTKRPNRMAEFSRWLASRGIAWPANLWAGTTITEESKTPRIDQLLEVGTDSTVRFLSVEPQWGAIRLRKWLPHLDWVIQGGQSGADAEPFDLQWARDLRDECAKAGVAFFLKQLGAKPQDAGKPLKLRDAHGGDWSEWLKDLRVRQMPAIADADGSPAA